MTLEFHPEARAEFRDAAHWYESRSLFAGDQFLSAVRLASEAILSDPIRYQQVEAGIRVFRLKRFPFRLYYAFDDETQIVCI